MSLSDIATIPVNIAGIPGISIPGGFLDDRPIDMQLIGPAWSEATLFRAAYAYEQATNWWKLKAPVR
ncbi:MAG: hypothetical protein HY261_03605 [Chloroflexi bacterium]|nr:hypothetical protein [Chloroflexota bacterium]